MPNELTNIQFQRFTGAGAIAETLVPGVAFRLLRIEVHWSAAPTTSQNITVTSDAGDGAAYDTLLTSRDPSADSLTDYVIEYGIGYEFEPDDGIDLAYTNTDARTISGRFVYELPK